MNKAQLISALTALSLTCGGIATYGALTSINLRSIDDLMKLNPKSMNAAEQDLQKIFADDQTPKTDSLEESLTIYSSHPSETIHAKINSPQIAWLKKTVATQPRPAILALYQNASLQARLFESVPACKNPPASMKPGLDMHSQFSNGLKRGLAGMILEEKSVIPPCQTLCCKWAERLGIDAIAKAHPEACKDDAKTTFNALQGECTRTNTRDGGSCKMNDSTKLNANQLFIRACRAHALLKLLSTDEEGNTTYICKSNPHRSATPARTDRDSKGDFPTSTSRHQESNPGDATRSE